MAPLHGYHQRMSGNERVTLPPVATDGRVDILTGLDAPEIFYKFLQKEIAAARRNPGYLLTLLRIRMDVARLVDFHCHLSPNNSKDIQDITAFLEIEVAALANSLRAITRSDENLVRIGDVTFLVMARVGSEGEVDSTLARFKMSLAEVGLAKVRGDENVEKLVPVDIQETYFFVDAFVYETGEEILDFLERAGV